MSVVGDVAGFFAFCAFEYVIDPLIDRLYGCDFDAYEAAKRAEFYRQHQYD